MSLFERIKSFFHPYNIIISLYQYITNNNRKLLENNKSDTPVYYHDYIDDAIIKYPDDEMIIKRFSDHNVLFMYMIPTNKLDHLLTTIWIRRDNNKIIITYHGKEYIWYQSSLIDSHIDEWFDDARDSISGPDSDILVHFRDKPNYHNWILL